MLFAQNKRKNFKRTSLLGLILSLGSLLAMSLLGQTPSAYAASTIGYLYVDGQGYNIEIMTEDELTGPGWKYVKSSNLLTLDNFTGVSKGISGNGHVKADLQIHLKGHNTLNVGPEERAIGNGTTGQGAVKITAEPGATLTINTQADGSHMRLIDVGDYTQMGGAVTIKHTLPASGTTRYFSMIELSGSNRKLELHNDASLTINAQADGRNTLRAIHLGGGGEAKLQTSGQLNVVIDKPNWLSALPSSSQAAFALTGFGNDQLTIGGTGSHTFQTITSRATNVNVTLEAGQKLVEPNRPDFVSGKLTDKKLRFQHGVVTAPQHKLHVNCGPNGVYATVPDKEQYDSGEAVKFVAMADHGYVIDQLSVDGVTVPAAANQTDFDHYVTMTADVTIDVSYKKAHYNVLPSGLFANGTMVANPAFAEAGQEVIFTVTPDSGYRLKKLTYVRSGTSDTPTDITADKKFIMPAHDVDYAAEFELIPPTTYTVAITDGTATPTIATAGTTVNLVANPAPAGKVFDKWTTDTAGVIFAKAANPSTNFIMPAANVKIVATYKMAPIPSLSLQVDKLVLEQNSNLEVKIKSGDVSLLNQKLEIWLESTPTKLGELVLTNHDWHVKNFTIPCSITSGRHNLKIKRGSVLLANLALDVKSSKSCLNNATKPTPSASATGLAASYRSLLIAAVFLTILGVFGLVKSAKCNN